MTTAEEFTDRRRHCFFRDRAVHLVRRVDLVNKQTACGKWVWDKASKSLPRYTPVTCQDCTDKVTVAPLDELVRWLGEQLDEDERNARAATLGPWVQSGIGDYGWTVDFGRPGAGVETADTEQGLADADFIAAHNPARMLREIDAKRRILAEHALNGWVCSTCDNEEDFDQGFPCPTLRLLALPYADRPGYQESWRP